MEGCWQMEPDERPTFAKILHRLDSLTEAEIYEETEITKTPQKKRTRRWTEAAKPVTATEGGDSSAVQTEITKSIAANKKASHRDLKKNKTKAKLPDKEDKGDKAELPSAATTNYTSITTLSTAE